WRGVRGDSRPGWCDIAHFGRALVPLFFVRLMPWKATYMRTTAAAKNVHESPLADGSVASLAVFQKVPRRRRIENSGASFRQVPSTPIDVSSARKPVRRIEASGPTT